MRTNLVESPRRAVAMRGNLPAGVVVHADRGSQYNSGQLAQLAHRHGLARSVGRTGLCWNNAQIESSWSTLKSESYGWFLWPSKQSARVAVGDWIKRVYDRRVRHSKLGMITPFFEVYGSAAAICACEQGRYHVLPGYAIVEFLEGGEIVETPLFNHAFPLLRYRSGDTATPEQGEGNCPCGRAAFPVVKQIEGRLDSYIVTPEGRLVGRLNHISKEVKHIAESQIVQESVGRVTLKVVRDVDYTPHDEALLVRNARERLGPAMEVVVEHVERIPRTARGKLVAVVGLEERNESGQAV
jgi:putative transposase